MKAFLVALVAMAVIAIGADLYLETLGFSSAESYATSNVRLGDCVALGVAETEAAEECLPADATPE